MIDRFTKQDLLKLVQKQNDPCVTIYLSTEKSGREIYKPVTQLKKLVETAKQKLAVNWLSEVDAEKYLEPITALTGNETFWQQTDQGLALFLNGDSLQKWRVAEPFGEHVFVSRQFFTRPILATADRDESFFVLALSKNGAELYSVDEAGIDRVDVPNMPTSVEAAMNVSSVERGAQVHTAATEHKGKQGGVFHGQGGKPDTSKEDAKQFYRQVDHAVTQYLGAGRKPVVLAADTSQASIYRETNTYSNLLGTAAGGRADEMAEQQLLARALPVMKKHQCGLRELAFESYRAKANTPGTLSEVSAIIAAAHAGQVDKLFVSSTASLPGEFNPAGQTIDYYTSPNDGDLDLVEDAIAQTLLHRGNVFTVSENEMPAGEPIVATLRY